MGIHFVLLISRQGKVRLTKWYSAMPSKERARTVREVSAVVLARQQKQCNFLEYKDKKIIYKRCVAGTGSAHWPADPPPAAGSAWGSVVPALTSGRSATLRTDGTLLPGWTQVCVAILFGVRGRGR
jgi:hypothetical protein